MSMSTVENTQMAAETGADSAAVPAVEGEVVSVSESLVGQVTVGESATVSESLVGYLAAGEVSCEESLILVGNVGTLGGNARVLLEGKTAILAAIIEAVVIGLILSLLCRKKR
jgi:hypothetical protein